jgi:hypothetical protein
MFDDEWHEYEDHVGEGPDPWWQRPEPLQPLPPETPDEQQQLIPF